MTKLHYYRYQLLQNASCIDRLEYFYIYLHLYSVVLSLLVGVEVFLQGTGIFRLEGPNKISIHFPNIVEPLKNLSENNLVMSNQLPGIISIRNAKKASPVNTWFNANNKRLNSSYNKKIQTTIISEALCTYEYNWECYISATKTASIRLDNGEVSCEYIL